MISSPRRRMLLADLSLVLVAVFWGVGFVAMKDALANYPTFWLLTLRFSAATALMALIFRKRLTSLTREDLRAGAIIGTLLFLGFAAQTLGLNYTTPGKQAFLTATYVVLVPFLAWGFSGTFPGKFPFAASLICLAGMGLLTLQGGKFQLNIGDGLTLVCAFFFAAQLIAIEHFASKRDPIVLAVLQIAVSALLSLSPALLFETWPGIVPGTGLWSIAFTVLFCTVIAFLVQNVAQKYTSSTHAAILLSLESLFGALSGVLFTGEVFTDRMVAGCMLIFLAVLVTEAGATLAERFSRKRVGQERN